MTEHRPKMKAKVPVRFRKGFFDTKEIDVEIAEINEQKGIVRVSYLTDMFDNGTKTEYTVTLSLSDLK